MSNEPPVPDASQIRRRLGSWLEGVAGQEDGRALSIHLGDVYPACAHVVRLVERMLEMAASPVDPEVRRTLAVLNGELTDHLLPHLEQLRPTLEAVLERLYEDAGAGRD